MNLLNSILWQNNVTFLGSRLMEYVRGLEMAGEPLLALDVLTSRPPLLRDLPEMKEYEDTLRTKVRHALDSTAYLSRYAEPGFKPLADTKLMTVPRYRLVRETIASVRPTRMASIGPGDGSFEAAVVADGFLETLVLADVSQTLASVQNAISALPESAGCQIDVVPLDGLYHPLPTPESLVLCLEVLEHTPDPHKFLQSLADSVADSGTLLLTTPAAEFWVESLIPQRSDGWYWHLTSQTRETLGRALLGVGFTHVEIAYTPEGHLFAVAEKG